SASVGGAVATTGRSLTAHAEYCRRLIALGTALGRENAALQRPYFVELAHLDLNEDASGFRLHPARQGMDDGSPAVECNKCRRKLGTASYQACVVLRNPHDNLVAAFVPLGSLPAE